MVKKCRCLKVQETMLPGLHQRDMFNRLARLAMLMLQKTVWVKLISAI